MEEDILEIDDMNDFPEYEETEPTIEQKEYAQSLVGKWCVSKSNCTPFLSGLFCKVIAANDYSRGGNPSQVRITVLRSGAMFAFHNWWLISNTNLFDVVGSGWLILAKEKPAKYEYAKAYTSISLRVFVSWLSKENSALKYRWWNSHGLPYNYLPPINSLIAAFYDTGRAFKYGVYIR